MSREQDVMVTGRVVEMVTPPREDGLNSVFRVAIDEQHGEHISGRRELVSGREVVARPALAMVHSGVRLRAGDHVKLLCNPFPDNAHVCVMVRRGR